jgi:hypothetical protein
MNRLDTKPFLLSYYMITILCITNVSHYIRHNKCSVNDSFRSHWMNDCYSIIVNSSL